MAKKVMYLLSATDGFSIISNCLRLCKDKILNLSSNNERYCSSFFRCIGLARTSTTLIQVRKLFYIILFIYLFFLSLI